MNRFHNQQEIFDRVVTAMLAQGQRAHDNNICVYRAANGCKCAVGHLIPDDKYRAEFEGVIIARDRSTLGEEHRRVYDRLLSVVAEEIGHMGIDDPTRLFLINIQRAHDTANGRNGKPFRQDFGDRARAIAVLYDLNTVRLDEELAKYTAEQRTPESTL